MPSTQHAAHAYVLAVRSGPPELSVIGFGKGAGPQCKFWDRQVKASRVGSALIERHPLRKVKGGKALRDLPSRHPSPSGRPFGKAPRHRGRNGAAGP
jgi:hypothetical protein